jgi:hypothetical protein
MVVHRDLPNGPLMTTCVITKVTATKAYIPATGAAMKRIPPIILIQTIHLLSVLCYSTMFIGPFLANGGRLHNSVIRHVPLLREAALILLFGLPIAIIFGIIVVVCSLRNRDRLWAAGLSFAGLGPLLFVLINWVTLFCELILAH